MKITFFVFFLLYIVFLITLVLFDGYFGRAGVENIPNWTKDAFKEYFSTSVNLIPLRTVFEFLTGVFSGVVSPIVFAVNIFGNLAAFAPFAFFLPLIFDKQKSFGLFLFSMIAIVLSAEILQLLLLTGAFDIDDLILNVVGACMLYRLFKIRSIDKIIKTITFT